MNIRCPVCDAEIDSETGEATIPDGSNAASITALQEDNNKLRKHVKTLIDAVQKLRGKNDGNGKEERTGSGGGIKFPWEK